VPGIEPDDEKTEAGSDDVGEGSHGRPRAVPLQGDETVEADPLQPDAADGAQDLHSRRQGPPQGSGKGRVGGFVDPDGAGVVPLDDEGDDPSFALHGGEGAQMPPPAGGGGVGEEAGATDDEGDGLGLHQGRGKGPGEPRPGRGVGADQEEVGPPAAETRLAAGRSVSGQGGDGTTGDGGGEDSGREAGVHRGPARRPIFREGDEEEVGRRSAV
jgi:hypothetical protein